MMNDELRPYELKQVDDIPWIERIPAHWDVQRGKAVYKKLNRPTRSNDEVVTCFRDGVVTLRKNRRTTGFTESIKEIGYQGIRKGDLVIHVMDAFAGAIGVSDSDGKGTPVYSVCEAKVDLNNYYYAYVIREMAKTGFIQSLYRGIRERSSDFRFEVFANQYLPIPPRSEQDQIVKYLDHQMAKINKFIKAKKKLIAVLKEQKQAIINEAVTKGLDPNVKMKPSGIEWLGDVPEHWKIVQLKRLAKKIKTGGTPSGADEQFFADEGFNWYTPGDFTDAVILSNATRQLSALGLKEVNIFPPKTVMMIGIGGTMGKVSLANAESSCNQQINAISCGKEIQPEFLVQYLRAAKPHIFATAKYTTLPILNQEETKKILVPLVPIDEQEKIISFINQKTVVFDNSIKKLENELQLINEYKNSLISDVVTGKVDVRNIVIEESEEDIIEDAELDEESVDEEVLEAEDGDE